MYSARLSLLFASVRRTELWILKYEFVQESRFCAKSSARTSVCTTSQMSRRRNTSVICSRSEGDMWMNRPTSWKPPSITRQ